MFLQDTWRRELFINFINLLVDWQLISFPKSAINYRNISDYVVKSSMRRNCTWGTDIELFAADLLFKTDIWYLARIWGTSGWYFLVKVPSYSTH